MSDPQVITVAIKDVVADSNWNVRRRQNYDDLDKFGTSIKKFGQDNPVMVSPADDKGKYYLYAGFRRYYAMKKVGLKTIMVHIKDNLDPKACRLLNLRENVERNDLNTYELALGCISLRDEFKMSGASIANALGGAKSLSKSHVNKLMGCVDKLIDPIVEAWGDNDHPAHPLCVVNALEKIAPLTKEEQATKWEDLRGGTAPSQTGNPRQDSSGQDVDPPPATAKAIRLMVMIEAMDLLKTTRKTDGAFSQEAYDTCMATLLWTSGKRKTLKIDGVVIYSAAAIAKAKKKEKADAKAESAAEKRAGKLEKMKEEQAKLTAAMKELEDA